MILIGEFRIDLSPEDTFRERTIEFDVPKDASKLQIVWTYTPRGLTNRSESEQIADRVLRSYLPDDEERKVLFDYHVGKNQGLKNQIDFTLFSPDRFVGCANSRKRTVEITEEKATPGFLPGVPIGHCKLLINVFCVYTPHCEAHFTVQYEAASSVAEVVSC